MERSFVVAREEATGSSEKDHQIKQLVRIGIITVAGSASLLLVDQEPAVAVLSAFVVGSSMKRFLFSECRRFCLTESWLRQIARLKPVETKLTPIEAGALLRKYFNNDSGSNHYDGTGGGNAY